MSQLFGSPLKRAHQIAQQEAQLSRADETAEHLRWLHHWIEEAQAALTAADPNPKFEGGTLDPNQEIVVRYEKGRYRYAIYTTDTAGTKVMAQWMGKQWTITTTGPGWVELDYPPGTLLYSGDANRHMILIRMSNLKV